MKINHLKNNGFILVATIWILASISLAAAAFALWIQRNINIVSEQTEYTQRSLDLISTKSTLLYLLATHPKSKSGLVTSSIKEIKSTLIITADPLAGSIIPWTGKEITLDNRPYKGVNQALFSLHDEGAFIYINNPNSKSIEHLLINYQYTKQQIDALIDKLNDYIDTDDMNRLQGAEAYHYIKQNLAPPTNKKLSSILELNNVLGWKELLSKHPNILKSFTTAQRPLININSINTNLLAKITNITPNQLNNFIDHRNSQPFKTISQVDAVSGTNLYQQDVQYTTHPSQMTRLYLWYKKSRLIEQISIELTPRSTVDKPWKITNSFALPKPTKHDQNIPIKPNTSIFSDSAF